MRRRPAWLAIAPALLLCLGATSDPVKPAPPPASVPAMNSSTRVLCVTCPKPFDFTGHKEILEKLVANPYVGELRKALYVQDTLHQFESKAHFDNCDFDGATAYVNELLAEAGRYADAATAAKAANAATMKSAVLKAFFSIGQALHAVQDFYAHSNYVELQVPSAKKIDDIERILPWRPEGQARIKELQKAGLVSGFVFWGVPQKCQGDVPSHATLAKDGPTTASGKVNVAHLQNRTRHAIAIFLARETSLALLEDAFKRWPILKQVNGEYVALDVVIDRRGL